MEVKCPFCGADIGPVDPIAKPQVDCPSCAAPIDVATALVFAGAEPGDLPSVPAFSPSRSGPVDPIFLDDVPPGMSRHPTEVTPKVSFEEVPGTSPVAPPPPVPPKPSSFAAPAPRVEGVGSYGKRSNDLTQSREVVFAPGNERPSHRPAPATAGVHEQRRPTSSFSSRSPSPSSPPLSSPSFNSRSPSSSTLRPPPAHAPQPTGRADAFWEPSSPDSVSPFPSQSPTRTPRQDPTRPPAPRPGMAPLDDLPVSRARTPEFVVEASGFEPPPPPPPPPPLPPIEPSSSFPGDVFGASSSDFDLSREDSQPIALDSTAVPRSDPEPLPVPPVASSSDGDSDTMQLPSFDDFSAFLSDDERPAKPSGSPVAAPEAPSLPPMPPQPSLEDLGLPETNGSLSGQDPVLNPAVADPFGPMTGGGEDLGLSFDDLVLPEAGPASYDAGPDVARPAATPGIDLDSLLGEDSTATARRSWAAPNAAASEPLPELDLGTAAVWPSGMQVDGDGLSSIADETLPDPGVFDLELAAGPDMAPGPGSPPSPNGIVIQAKAGTAGMRQGTKKGKGGKIALLGLLAVVLAGVVLGQTSFGYFGMDLFKDKPGKRRPPAVAPVGAEHPSGEPIVGIGRDTKEAYLEEVARLEAALKEDSDSAALQDELRLVLARMNLRFPATLAADPALAARFEAVKKVAMAPGPVADFVRAIDLLADGKADEARSVLEPLAAAAAADPDIFTVLGRIDLAGDRPDDARKRFDAAIARSQDAIEARYLLARLQLADKDPGAARTGAAGILEKVPQHAGAKLVVARSALAAREYDRSIQLADEVSASGASLDSDDLFESRLVVVAVREAQGDKTGLIASLQAALAVRPDHEETAVKASILLRDAGRKDEALSVLGACRKRGVASESFLAAFAAAAFGAGREDEGNQVILEGREKFPKSSRFPMVDADHLVAAGRLAAAVALYEEALKLDPSSEEVLLKLGDVLARQGKGVEAVARMKAMLEKAGDRVPLMVAMAEIQRKLRDFTGAEAVLRRALAVEPSSTPVQTALGRVLFAQGRTDEAVSVLAAMDGRGQLDRAGMIALSAAYMDLKQPEKARDVMARQHEQASGDPDVASEFARTLMVTNANDRAAEVLRKAIADSPMHAGVHLQLGRLLFRTGDKDRAITELQRAVQLDPSNQRTRLELVRVLLDKGTHEVVAEAKGLLETILGAYSRGDVPVEEREADAYLFRGRLVFDKQGFGPALKDFEAALTLAPSRIDIMVAAGRVLFEMARYGDASNYFRQVLARDKGQPDANYFLGRIVLRDGRIEDAKAFLQASVARNPGLFPEAHRQLGLIYRDQGIRPLARNSLTKYLEYAPKGSSEADEVRRLLERM